MTRLWLTLAAALILTASPASAQDLGPPRVEIGGRLSVLVPVVFEDAPIALLGGGPLLGFNVTPRVGIEVLAETLGPVEGGGTTGLYMAQVKFPLGKFARVRALSLTIGGAGLFSYHRYPEHRLPRFDGSVVVRPAYRSLRVRAPGTLSVGVERERALGRRASGSVAVQGFIGPLGGFAVRAAAGMSFGIGRHR